MSLWLTNSYTYYSGESQQPFFPGFKRGLVAVLLYYDGRSSLVSTLRTLIQARKGRTWSLGLPDDILAVIMNFTTQLMNEGLAAKILCKFHFNR